MESGNIADRVKQIIVEQLGVKEDQVVPEARFIEDLSADSLDTVELVMRFEEAFDVKIPDDVVENMLTVGKAVKYLEEKVAAKAAGDGKQA
jgi:acyl carrier protein